VPDLGRALDPLDAVALVDGARVDDGAVSAIDGPVGTAYDVRLRAIVLSGCDLSGGRLPQLRVADGRLESVRFHGCDLSGADFRRARLARCEFRGCEMDAIVGAESLRGAALPWPEIVALAGTWAAALGIDVLDE
jgi:uncharacterized protein YjbI with pentapeptide repeats